MRKEYIIQKILKKIRGKTYLEIGILKGVSFLQIKARNKIGIDPSIKIPTRKRLLSHMRFGMTKYFEMTSDLFFKDHAESLFKDKKIDLAFIDGLHTYEQTLIDVDNTLPHLKENGIIILHDCNPPIESAAAEKIEQAKKISSGITPWCGTVWKAVVHLRSLNDNLKLFVLDCDFGVGVVTRETPDKKLNFTIEEVKKLEYKDLDKDRKNLLNLKDPDYLYSFLKN